jgi:hypothetical protein
MPIGSRNRGIERMEPTKTSQFAQAFREELGRAWRPVWFAPSILIVALLIWAMPPLDAGSLAYLGAFGLVGGLTGLIRVRALGVIRQVGVVLAAVTSAAAVVAFAWTRSIIGPERGLFDELGWRLPIPQPEYLLLAGLSLYVAASLTARWRERTKTV